MCVFESQNKSKAKLISLSFFGCRRLADLGDFKKVNEIYAKCELSLISVPTFVEIL